MTIQLYGDHKLAAQSFIASGAAGMTYGTTISFASGIQSPGCYIDCRKFPAHPQHWRKVIGQVASYITKAELSFDSIASVETGGIPHASVLGWETNTPSVWVRKKPKGYGVGQFIAGDVDFVHGKHVLLVEDMGTTGGSAATAVKRLRTEGAIVTDVILLVAYGFQDLLAEAEKLDVRFHSLCLFWHILEEKIKIGDVVSEYEQMVRDWLRNPWTMWQWQENRT